jgi:hypothetical protein
VSNLEAALGSTMTIDSPAVQNLPNFALDRLSRYEANLWRQAGRILYALEMLDRRKPQERTRRLWFASKNKIELE